MSATRELTAALDNLKDELIGRTLEVWQPRLGREDERRDR